MIYDLIGNEVHTAPKQMQIKYTEGKDVSKFYVRGNGKEVTATLRAMAPDAFTCIEEICACMLSGLTNSYRVTIEQRKHFFSRNVYEYAQVSDSSSTIIYETKRHVVQKPKPFNIAQVIG